MSVTFSDLLTVLSKAPTWFWIPVMLMAFVLMGRLYITGYAKTKLDTTAMDQLAKCMSHKAQLIAWGSKAVLHFSGCRGCAIAGQNGSRHDLEVEFKQMMKEML